LELNFNEIIRYVEDLKIKSLKQFKKDSESNLRKLKDKHNEDDRLLLNLRDLY
jgi:hypothetical protein